MVKGGHSELSVGVLRARAVLALADEVLHKSYLACVASSHVGRPSVDSHLAATVTRTKPYTPGPVNNSCAVQVLR